MTKRKVREFPPIAMRIRPETHEKLKLTANLLDITMTDIISNAIDAYLKSVDFNELFQKRIDKLK